MVDGRSMSTPSVTGGFNFKSGDISGTAAKTSDEKMGQGTEYFATYPQEEFLAQDPRYVDRSAQLSATLNSLAMMNVAGIMKKNKKAKNIEENIDEDLTLLAGIEEINYFDDEEDDENQDEKEEDKDEQYSQGPED